MSWLWWMLDAIAKLRGKRQDGMAFLLLQFMRLTGIRCGGKYLTWMNEEDSFWRTVQCEVFEVRRHHRSKASLVQTLFVPISEMACSKPF